MDFPDARISAATAAPRPEAARAQDDAAEVAREFEALFLTQAMDEMMRTVNVGSFGGGFAEDTWRSFLSRAVAEEIAGSGTTGIAKSVEGTIAAYRARMTESGT